MSDRLLDKCCCYVVVRQLHLVPDAVHIGPAAVADDAFVVAAASAAYVAAVDSPAAASVAAYCAGDFEFASDDAPDS